MRGQGGDIDGDDVTTGIVRGGIKGSPSRYRGGVEPTIKCLIKPTIQCLVQRAVRRGTSLEELLVLAGGD